MERMVEKRVSDEKDLYNRSRRQKIEGNSMKETGNVR